VSTILWNKKEDRKATYQEIKKLDESGDLAVNYYTKIPNPSLVWIELTDSAEQVFELQTESEANSLRTQLEKAEAVIEAAKKLDSTLRIPIYGHNDWEPYCQEHQELYYALEAYKATK